ncbi:protein DEK-like isoform X2 [Ipomoea triloba]|uniref:protein DEK-like isoform X2 n=1 Tax=Ipomoea triloba TaxID=35885 RepID=UPI00125E847E|nr:protein DEK-like isoform X2 [Ipomoea triloba]
MASVEGTLRVKLLAEETNQRQEEEEKEKPEEAKSEEVVEEDEEDGEKEKEENLEEESDGADKIQSSPGASLRPTRERKTVDRFYATPTSRPSATKLLSIQKGRGVQLRDIPNVAYKLSKRKPDENLQILHSILYGKKTKAYNLKKNIGQFSGYLWDENEHEKQRGRIQDKFDKCVKEKLLDFCDVLNLPVKSVTKKEELCLRLLEFLESPYATTDLLLADKKKKSKKQKSKATKPKSSVDRTAPSKRKVSSEWNEEADNTGDESQEDDQNDEDAEEESVPEGTDSEEEQNEKISSKKDYGTKIGDKVAGKDTPVKSSKSSKVVSAKRQKVGEDKSISVKEKASSRKLSKKDGKPRNVKADLEPSKEEIYTAAVNILKNVDFDTATLSDIIRQLGSHFGVDLMHKKAEVKAIVTDAMNNMSDDEGEAGDNESED